MSEELQAELKAAQAKIKELERQLAQAPTPEAVYAFNTNLVSGRGRGQWTMRARQGEDGANFIFRVEAMLEKLSERGWGDNTPQVPSGQLAQPAENPVSGTPLDNNSQVFDAETLSAETKEGKTYWKVKGGQWTKFGVTVWGEVLMQAGFHSLDPMKPYDLHGWRATCALNENGKPNKVTRLEKI